MQREIWNRYWSSSDLVTQSTRSPSHELINEKVDNLIYYLTTNLNLSDHLQVLQVVRVCLNDPYTNTDLINLLITELNRNAWQIYRKIPTVSDSIEQLNHQTSELTDILNNDINLMRYPDFTDVLLKCVPDKTVQEYLTSLDQMTIWNFLWADTREQTIGSTEQYLALKIQNIQYFLYSEELSNQQDALGLVYRLIKNTQSKPLLIEQLQILLWNFLWGDHREQTIGSTDQYLSLKIQNIQYFLYSEELSNQQDALGLVYRLIRNTPPKSLLRQEVTNMTNNNKLQILDIINTKNPNNQQINMLFIASLCQ